MQMCPIFKQYNYEVTKWNNMMMLFYDRSPITVSLVLVTKNSVVEFVL